MRPEVARTLGHERINAWNTLAVRGQLRRFAGGGIVERLGLGKLIDLSKSFAVGGDALAALATMSMDSSSRALGGTTQDGVLATGTGAARTVGANVAEQFSGIWHFLSRDSWTFLRRIPTAVGQAVGIVGGALGPQAGHYLWDDVWKGQGNIFQRGGKFLGDLFSPSNLLHMVEEVFKGLWDSAKGIWAVGRGLVTDPLGTIRDAANGVWDLAKSQYTGLVDMVKATKQIFTSPMDYASRVVHEVTSTAKDALPNTKGLWDFGSGDQLDATQPDMSNALGSMFSLPGVGDAVTRWAPLARAALMQLGLSET
nr:hypothetical protein [Streptomyces sp. SID5468]